MWLLVHLNYILNIYRTITPVVEFHFFILVPNVSRFVNVKPSYLISPTKYIKFESWNLAHVPIARRQKTDKIKNLDELVMKTLVYKITNRSFDILYISNKGKVWADVDDPDSGPKQDYGVLILHSP